MDLGKQGFYGPQLIPVLRRACTLWVEGIACSYFATAVACERWRAFA